MQDRRPGTKILSVAWLVLQGICKQLPHVWEVGKKAQHHCAFGLKGLHTDTKTQTISGTAANRLYPHVQLYQVTGKQQTRLCPFPGGAKKKLPSISPVWQDPSKSWTEVRSLSVLPCQWGRQSKEHSGRGRGLYILGSHA